MAYAPDGSILVVDDNAQISQALSELLQIEGFTVLSAQNGLDALNKMRAADRISLVLLDLWMPIMDGWEVVRRKASDPGIAEIPVVVVSAVPQDSLDGVEAILKKPVSPHHLLEMVRRFSK
jgi:CheY-like chemotaxis protein